MSLLARYRAAADRRLNHYQTTQDVIDRAAGAAGAPPARTAPPRNGNAARALMVAGALAAAAGYITMNTQLVLAYRGGTLANVHALCSSGLIQALNPSSAGQCSAINADYTLASVALYAGLLLAAAGLIIMVMQRSSAR